MLSFASINIFTQLGDGSGCRYQFRNKHYCNRTCRQTDTCGDRSGNFACCYQYRIWIRRNHHSRRKSGPDRVSGENSLKPQRIWTESFEVVINIISSISYIKITPIYAIEGERVKNISDSTGLPESSLRRTK